MLVTMAMRHDSLCGSLRRQRAVSNVWLWLRHSGVILDIHIQILYVNIAFSIGALYRLPLYAIPQIPPFPNKSSFSRLKSLSVYSYTHPGLVSASLLTSIAFHCLYHYHCYNSSIGSWKRHKLHVICIGLLVVKLNTFIWIVIKVGG